ncbi:MAG: insulinase family protein [Abditibacteriota bacterium]|nr:insulinase family protein [Abditibacteriota bacterium]
MLIKKTLLSIIAASVIFLALPVLAQTRDTLDSGLTVLTTSEPGSGLVAAVLFVKDGCANESLQFAGIGNFVANLILASTRNKSAEQVAAVADSVGGNMSVSRNADYTELRVITTSQQFGTALSLMGEAVTEANFESEWVESVRKSLLSQAAAENDNVFVNAYEQLLTMIYDDSPYRRTATDTLRTIKTAKPADLRNYYNKYDVPGNMILSVAGDVSREQVLERAKIAFAGIAPKQVPATRAPAEETLERSESFMDQRDVKTGYFLMGWLAPEVSSPDYPAMSVAVNALGGGKGSAMFRNIRQKKGMGYDIGTLYPARKYQSHAVAYIITDPFKQTPQGYVGQPVLEEVKDALLEEVNRLKTELLTEDELTRAKGYTLGKHILAHQRMFDRAVMPGLWEILSGTPDFDDKYTAELEKVTAEDVRKAAEKYFTNYGLFILLPRFGE